MNPSDFVYDQIYKGALNKQASQRWAQHHALLGLEDWKKNKIPSKTSKLIEARIKKAVQDTKKIG
tara:strand:- start:52 stop:246 length:195 start_codon:yes stop_codon:yes gene_type:complete